MITPLIELHVKFFLSLTLPTNNPTTSFGGLLEYIMVLEPFNPKMQLSVLDASFFHGLELIYKRLLFDSFQLFMKGQDEKDTYYQNRVPKVYDSDEESSASDGDGDLPTEVDEQVIEINWDTHFRFKYVPAVLAFVKSYVDKKSKIATDPDELAALGCMSSKVYYFLRKSITSANLASQGPYWLDCGTPPPFICPSFLNSFLASLNEVDDAVLAVGFFLSDYQSDSDCFADPCPAGAHDAATRQGFQRNEGPFSCVCVEIVGSSLVDKATKQGKIGALDEAGTLFIFNFGFPVTHFFFFFKLTTTLLFHRDTGLAALKRYLAKNKPPTLSPKQINTHFSHQTSLPAKYAESLEGIALDCFNLNSLQYSLVLEKNSKLSLSAFLKKHTKDFGNAEFGQAIFYMMLSTYYNWTFAKAPEVAASCSRISQALIEAYQLAKVVLDACSADSTIYAVFQDLEDAVKEAATGMEGVGIYMWTNRLGWKVDTSTHVQADDDDHLSYLAPLQQNAAHDMQETTQKDVVSRLNRIMQDAAYISSVDGSMPDDVNTSLKTLIHVRFLIIFLVAVFCVDVVFSNSNIVAWPRSRNTNR